MTEDLSICRSVMRIYSFCAVDEKTHRIKITGAHEIVKSYFEIESELKSNLANYEIEMYPTGVYSCFGNEIKIALEMFFIYTACSFPVPDEIISCLAKFLLSLGRNPLPQTSQVLQWAYTGRYLNRSNANMYITDGLQMSDNRIVIDILTYVTASHDCLHHRLIHELLHTIGVEEDEMDQLILPACAITYEVAKPFIESLHNQVKEILEDFIGKIREFQSKNPETKMRLLQMGNDLCKYGFPTKIDDPIYTTTYMPNRLLPTPSITGYSVLFM